MDYMDPLVYWLSDYLPTANIFGLLRSPFLLRIGMPFLKILPRVPAGEIAIRPASNDEEAIHNERREKARKIIRISKFHEIQGIVFYVLKINGRYAGEFRYSALRELHGIIGKHWNQSLPFPSFPGKTIFSADEKQLEERRVALEEYLQFVLAEPSVVKTDEFVKFVKDHRRWDRETRLLASPA
jgi:hypothetical protein